MAAMTIGEVAKRTGVGVETIRFYEKQGLLAAPPRRRATSPSQAGRREYPPDAVVRIRFVQRAKELGFSLKEIGELLSLRLEPGITCANVRAKATAKLANIEQKIDTLGRMKTALVKLVKGCSGTGPTSECPILEALDREGN